MTTSSKALDAELLVEEPTWTYAQFCAALEGIGGYALEPEDTTNVTIILSPNLAKRMRRPHRLTFAGREFIPTSFIVSVMDLDFFDRHGHHRSPRPAPPCRRCKSSKGLDVPSTAEFLGAPVCPLCWFWCQMNGESAVRLAKDYRLTADPVIGNCVHCSAEMTRRGSGAALSEQLSVYGRSLGLCGLCWTNRAVRIDSEGHFA